MYQYWFIGCNKWTKGTNQHVKVGKIRVCEARPVWTVVSSSRDTQGVSNGKQAMQFREAWALGPGSIASKTSPAWNSLQGGL